MAVLDWDPTPYPDPRAKRAGATVSLDPTETPEVIVPRVYPWSIHVQSATATHRIRVGSRMIRGPALIRSVTPTWGYINNAASPSVVFSLFYQEAPYAREAIELTTQPTPGTSIFELDFLRASGSSQALQPGLIPQLALTTYGPVTIPLMFPINLPEFSLAAVIDVNNNTSTEVSALVSIFEQIDPRFVGRFMS